MVRRLKKLCGLTVQATDGEAGTVDDLYFRDENWRIRYLVAATTSWFSNRRVLIAINALGRPYWEEQVVFPVDLTRTQVKNSPHIDLDKPVSEQQLVGLHAYYGWSTYKYRSGDQHLRSAKEVIGYHIRARDGGIGHVDDFLVDDAAWIIRYLIVDTRNWLPGRKVLISPRWIPEVSWRQKEVYADLTRDEIKSAPEWDPDSPLGREYETRLHEHYGRPPYWV